MSVDLATATETELREFDVPWPKTIDELVAIVNSLVQRQHDYGTCVYAMSIAATAALNYVSSMLGATGFQVSCADLDILRRTRGMEHGFRIVNYSKLLYPQYQDEVHLSAAQLLSDPGTRKRIREAARKLLEGKETLAHPDVVAHWRILAVLPVLDGEEVRS